MKLQILLLLAFSTFVTAGVVDTVSGALGVTNTSETELSIHSPIVALLKKLIDESLEKIAIAVEAGEKIDRNLVNTVIDLGNQLKDNEIPIDDRARDIIEEIINQVPELGNELAALLK